MSVNIYIVDMQGLFAILLLKHHDTKERVFSEGGLWLHLNTKIVTCRPLWKMTYMVLANVTQYLFFLNSRNSMNYKELWCYCCLKDPSFIFFAVIFLTECHSYSSCPRVRYVVALIITMYECRSELAGTQWCLRILVLPKVEMWAPTKSGQSLEFHA